jgi:hypothetical protein
MYPPVHLYNPHGVERWLLSSVDPANRDRAFGLIDLGTGMPELAEVSLTELSAFRSRKNAVVRADRKFVPQRTLRQYTAWARLIGWILT